MKVICGKCGGFIWWEISLWKRLKELFQKKKPSRVCEKCYNKFKEGK